MDSGGAFKSVPKGRGKSIKTQKSSRNQSFSSLSSCSSSFESSSDYSPLSPTTPLSGIPFSWEKLPGIPKKQAPVCKDQYSSSNLLPLPPSKRFNVDKMLSNPKKDSSPSFRMDPFFAALVKCSKDDERRGRDRSGFIDLYASCKKTCNVTDSIVYVPRLSRNSYRLLNRSSK